MKKKAVVLTKAHDVKPARKLKPSAAKKPRKLAKKKPAPKAAAKPRKLKKKPAPKAAPKAAAKPRAAPRKKPTEAKDTKLVLVQTRVSERCARWLAQFAELDGRTIGGWLRKHLEEEHKRMTKGDSASSTSAGTEDRVSVIEAAQLRGAAQLADVAVQVFGLRKTLEQFGSPELVAYLRPLPQMLILGHLSAADRRPIPEMYGGDEAPTLPPQRRRSSTRRRRNPLSVVEAPKVTQTPPAPESAAPDTIDVAEDEIDSPPAQPGEMLHA